MKRFQGIAVLSLLTLLTACPVLTITFTSPVEGQRITGSRTLAVSGTVVGPIPERQLISLSVNGGKRVYAPVIAGRFTAPVQLADGDNLILAVLRAGPFAVKSAVRVVYDAEAAPPLAVQVTSPARGEKLTGNSKKTVRGTVNGPAKTVTVSVNGGAPVVATVTGGTFSAEVELAEGENTVVALASSEAQSASTTVQVSYETSPPPAIAISAPAEGAVVLGSRAVTVRGTVAHATSPSVLVAVGGGAPLAADVAEDGSFTAEVQLPDGTSALVASLLAAEGAAAATVHVTYPFLALETFQAAERVLGRASPTATAPGPCDDPEVPITRSDLCYPFGSAGWDGATLFVSDWSRNRVLAFAGLPAEDGAAAAFALGQPDFTQGAASTAAGGLGGPETVRISDGKLFVAEYANNRLLIFDPVPDGFGATAAVAVGAPSVDVAGSGACAPDTLLRPESFTIVGTRLIVADAGHNRVLVWNEIPTVSGTPPDLVLGQPDLTSCEPNVDGISGRTLFWPTDVWSDGARLLVADTMNNRVLGWDALPDASFAPADLVLGQPSFTVNQPATARGALFQPNAVASNGNQLFVADQGSHRVLVWNTLPTTTGALPDVVLGQADFDHGKPNDADQDGVSDPAPNARTLDWPAGVTVTADALVVTDSRNSRHLVFRTR